MRHTLVPGTTTTGKVGYDVTTTAVAACRFVWFSFRQHMHMVRVASTCIIDAICTYCLEIGLTDLELTRSFIHVDTVYDES